MISVDDNRFFFPAWGISLTLHGFAVGLAVMFATQVKPLLSEEVFQWDVALVEATTPNPRTEHVESVVPPPQPTAKATPPVPKILQPIRATAQAAEPPRPTIETVRPIEQKVERPQVHEEPVEQSIAEVAEPKSEPVAVVASLEPVESPPVQQESVAAAPPSSPEAPVTQEAPALASSQDSSVDAAPVQVTRAAGPSAEAKIDHQWLAESLWRRVAELKRYPNSARMNSQEGKVILKAVIRADGHLADVFVLKSSGYSALDAAAMEAVRLACPLHMKHAIGKPQIVVSLPIVYSLAN
ncbi:MAG: energy transducer TonB [Nitrospira sp.]|nr:MAG: energy transducer TonB [Nitrospira sp.]TKB77141.1 MAG: energy transducer TonB [Nitrospira sp.]